MKSELEIFTQRLEAQRLVVANVQATRDFARLKTEMAKLFKLSRDVAEIKKGVRYKY